ncbi:MAG: response regulator transcription factor [Gammaproteobacteria bacterium]|nr:response regulator transcription factor [Gammaproteobacteria bacterium]
MAIKDNQVVFIVDDDKAVRDSLRLLMKSVGLDTKTFASGREFLEEYQPETCGCLVLDIRMPGMSGLELQEQLVAKGIDLPIIFITGHGDVPMAVQAMKRGATDFIQKPFRDQELLDRVNDALKYSRSDRQHSVEKNETMRRVDTLTPRELEIMNMIVDGKASKVIAIDLGVSQRTVETHRARVMEKMDARSLAHLIQMAILARTDLIDSRG